MLQREIPGVNTEIIYQWPRKFVDETAELRVNNQHLLLVIDEYSSPVQFPTLQLFKESNIVFIALPSHSYHVLHSLHVTVFGPYKPYLQQEMHSAEMKRRIQNALDTGECISQGYSPAVVGPNAKRRFIKTGLWNPERLSADDTALFSLFEGNRAEGDGGQVQL